MKRIALILIFLAAAPRMAAQTDSVQTQKVTVTRSYEPTVRDADKINANPETGQDASFGKKKVDYRLRELEAVSTFQAEKGKLTRPSVSLSGATEVPGYAYLAVGYPLQMNAGGGYVHQTDNGWKISGEADYDYKAATRTQGYAFGHDHRLGLHALAEKDADLWRTRYGLDYGLTASARRDTLNPLTSVADPFAYHQLHPYFKGDFHRTVFRDLNAAYTLTAGRGLAEHDWKLLWNNVFPIGSFKIQTGWDLSGLAGRTDSLSYNNFQAGLMPSLRLEKERLLFKLGFKLYYQNRTDINDQVLFYPDVSVDFRMVEEYLTLFLGYQGGLRQAGYRDWVVENPYILPVTDGRPVSTAYHIAGGFKGAVSSAMSYNLELGVRRQNDYPFMVYHTVTGRAGFVTVYDRLDDYYFRVLLSYVKPSKFETKIRFLYAQYTPARLHKPYNLADYTLDWLMRFRIGDFGWESILSYVGPRYDLVGGSEIKNREYIGSQLRLSYHINKDMYLYLGGRNLLAKPYTPYTFYPERGLQLTLGAFYSF